MKQSETFSEIDRKIICRLIYGFLFLMAIMYGYTNYGLHQLRQPVLKYPLVDNTFWLFFLLKIPQTIIGSAVLAWSVEISVVVMIALCFLFPFKRFFHLLMILLLSLFYISFCAYSGHHMHPMVSVMLMPVLFLSKSNQGFYRLFELMRYYACFLFSSAALWKIFRGSLFDPEHFSTVMKMQHLGNQGVYDEFLIGTVVQTLMSDSGIAMIIFILLGLLQLTFGVGFFTKKLDSILLLFLLIFLGGTIILMRIPFLEFFILAILFLPQTRVYDIMKKRLIKIRTVLPQERPA